MVQVGVESENGWRPPDLRPGDPLLVWKTIPGTNPAVNIQVMRGLPEVFLPAWLADWNAYLEPLEDNTTASYTDGNSVYTSNHKNGTAADADWEKHPFQQRGSFNAIQMNILSQMENFYENWIFWAGRWDDPVDEMHSQMGYNTWNRNTAALDFISRKIRSDGFSTFRRGSLPGENSAAGNPPAAPTPDPSTSDDAIQALYDAVPIIDMGRAAELVDEIVKGLALAECINVKRIAMWLAQVGEESAGFVYTEEIAKNGRYAPYIGRTWIQITWQSNYAAFGQWAFDQRLISDSNQFVNNPESLADDQWASIGPAWYWTVARPAINSLCDNGDIAGVTQLINGGQNGIENRTDRYNQAIALGDRLLLLIKDDTSDDNTHDNSDEDVIELPDTVTRVEWDALIQKVDEILNQLNGDWPQNSNDLSEANKLDQRKTAGEKLSVNDLLCWLKNHVSTHKVPTP